MNPKIFEYAGKIVVFAISTGIIIAGKIFNNKKR